MHISVVGLGKLGAPFAALAAANGHTVVGVDLIAATVEAVNGGRAPVFEPELQELLAKTHGRLVATHDMAAAVATTEATFVVVPTPSDERGGFSLRHVLTTMEEIGGALRRKSAYHLVVVTSTVLPGATDGEIRDTLERASGKECGVEFGLCYNPEFIALGSVIRDMRRPDLVLIGESDSRAGDVLVAFQRSMVENDAPIVRMSFVNAELAKLAINTFVTTKISYANMLAEVCERLPGADVDIVTAAIGVDTRIGSKYLRGGLAYGGPCFPRDNLAFAALARSIQANSALADATDVLNRAQTERVASLVRSRLPAGGTVGILGLAYKPETNIVEEAAGLVLAEKLAEHASVVVFDPAAHENARQSLGDTVRFARSPADCVATADVLVIATPWEEFRSLSAENFAHREEPCVVIDCWRMLDPERLGAQVEYLPLGRGSAYARKTPGASLDGSIDVGVTARS